VKKIAACNQSWKMSHGDVGTRSK